MYERILIPLDGSKIGEAALPYIEELVSKLLPEPKIEVTLLQVLATLTHWIVSGEATARVAYTEEEIRQIQNKAVDYLTKAGEGLRSRGAIVRIKVRTGRAADEIIKVADESKVDLVAMSTHGRSGIGRWAFGSVTDKVLQSGTAPILTVRAPKEAEQA